MISILLFGVTREIVGGNTIEVPQEAFGGNVGSLKEHLTDKYPGLAEIASLRIAVNNEFAGEDTVIGSKDEVALIPPVSGG